MTTQKPVTETEIEIVEFTNQTGERRYRYTGGRTTRGYSTRNGMQWEAHQAFLRKRDRNNPDACDEPRLRKLIEELQAELKWLARELGTTEHPSWHDAVYPDRFKEWLAKHPAYPVFKAAVQKLPENREALVSLVKQLNTMKMLAETELEEKKKRDEAEKKRNREEAELREKLRAKQRQEERERHRREMEEYRLRTLEELRLQRQERERQAEQEREERRLRLDFLLKCLEDKMPVDLTHKDMELLREHFHDRELEPEAPQWAFHRAKRFSQLKDRGNDLPMKVGMRGRWGRIFRGKRSQNQNCSHYRHLGRTKHSARREYWVRNRPRSG